MLQIRNLRKSFGDLQVLKSIDLDVNKGDVVAILGPSGSGKTTMLRCLNFLEKSDGGTMLFDDQRVDLARVTHAEANALRRRTGFVFQSYNLFANKTALQNVTEGLVIARKMDKHQADEIARAALDKVGMGDRCDHYPSQLSGGQQQRVALARILCSEPEAILLDEPFSALDSYLKWNLEIELADLLATFNGPILWVSHDRDECYRNCRSVCVMEDGRTGEVTPMDEMIRHPGSVSAARLAGCKNFFAAEARDGKVYLPEWNVALPLAGMENTFTTIGIPDNAVTMSENGAMSCTVCRVILGVEENILLLCPEGSAEGAPMLRITVGHESDLQAGAAVRVALDDSKLLLL